MYFVRWQLRIVCCLMISGSLFVVCVLFAVACYVLLDVSGCLLVVGVCC